MSGSFLLQPPASNDADEKSIGQGYEAGGAVWASRLRSATNQMKKMKKMKKNRAIEFLRGIAVSGRRRRTVCAQIGDFKVANVRRAAGKFDLRLSLVGIGLYVAPTLGAHVQVAGASPCVAWMRCVGDNELDEAISVRFLARHGLRLIAVRTITNPTL